MRDSTQTWYHVRPLFPGVWGIEERGVNCYLIAGRERALLVDAGWGFGDLRGLVASLTALPVTLVNTHGHPDHVSGDGQFGEAFISAAELSLPFVASTDARRGMLERLASRGMPPAGYDTQAWLDAPLPAFHPLPPDASFELGGRTIQVIPTPGHTPGSVCLLDAGARVLCTGDSIVAGPILMFLEHSLTLREYADSLRTLATYLPQIDYLLPGHGSEPLPSSRITELLHGADAILRGDVTGEPEQTPLGPALCAEFATCKICYLKEKLG